MNNNILIDNINIKTLPEMIINFLKHQNINSNLNNVRNIYSLILSEISIDVKESYLNKIQKYLSSNEACTILIFDDINDGIYDEELNSACRTISETINKANDSTSFYQELINLCYFIHFKDDELDNINSSFKNKEYSKLIFYLFKHAIKNYKISTPKILAKRIYDEAMTLTNGIPIRKNLFKIAADLGNSHAALEYGSIIYDEDLDNRIIYLLKSKDLDVSLWKLSYIVEHSNLTQQQFELIKKELRELINFSNNYDVCKNIYPAIAKNNFEKECTIVAFKIYFYLATKKNFSKGYNSIGKFLINNKIVYVDKDNNIDEEKTKIIGIKYLKHGVSLSNIYAMENLAMYYRKNNINLNLIKPLLTIGADNEDLISCVELSKILMSEDKFDEATNYLKYASSQNSAYAQHNLAKLYENKFDYDSAKYWYKEAIKNGSKASAVNLAQIYFKEYVDDNTSMKNSYLIYAINILKKHKYNLDDEHKEIALKLISEWTNILD